MSGRAVAEALTAVLITAVLLLVGAGLLALDGAESPAAAFLDAGPRSAGSLLGVPFLVWAAALLLAARLGRRTVGARLGIGIAVTLGIGLLTLAFWAIVGLASGGLGMLLVAIALVHVALFCAAAGVALALTSLVLFRRRPVAEAAAA